MFTKYRVYADGTVVHQDDFSERDNALPFHDDYGEYSIPDELVEYIQNSD